MVSYTLQLIVYLVSPTCPWFAAPSPYSVTQILSEFSYFRASAMPAPTGTCHVTTRRKEAVMIWFPPRTNEKCLPFQGYTTISLPGLRQSHFHHNSSQRTCVWSPPFPGHSQCSWLCGQREQRMFCEQEHSNKDKQSLHTPQDTTIPGTHCEEEEEEERALALFQAFLPSLSTGNQSTRLRLARS